VVFHFLADDCPPASIGCVSRRDGGEVGRIGPLDYCWQAEVLACVPCEHIEPLHALDLGQLISYWNERCDELFGCDDGCKATGVTWYTS
jgi:hypothetical protein